MGFRHVVLFRLRPEADPDEVIGQLARLGDFPEISLQIHRSLDERKGVVIIEDCLFPNKSAFRDFQSWPLHAELGTFMRTRSDWLIADFEETEDAASPRG